MFKINYVKIVLWVLGIALSIFTGVTVDKNLKLKKENERLFNNNSAYADQLDTLSREKGVFLLTIGELKESKDTLYLRLKSLERELGIKDKQVKELTGFKSRVRVDTVFVPDTVLLGIPFEQVVLKERFQFNPYTLLSMDLKFGKVTLGAEISDCYYIYLYEKKEWKQKGWFKRLFKFKWGKRVLERSVLEHDNELIQVSGFKVQKIIE
jgi:hypothetical protein